MRKTPSFWLVAALAACASLMARPLAAQSPESIRIADEAMEVVQSRCVSCHHPGGDAPFSLASFDDVRRRSSAIVQVIKSGYMPPWKPVAGYGEFQGSRRMTAHEIELLEQWVRAGAPAGSRSPANAVAGSSERELAQPDLVVTLPKYQLRADGPDVFRNFAVSLPANASGFVRGMQFRPGSPGVHHANIRVDRTPASRQLDDADPTPGYEGVIARTADYPDGQFLGWTPGQLTPTLSDELAWRIQSGSDLVVQLHLRPTGKVETISPTIGFFLGTRAPSRTPTMIRLGRQDLDIPANAAAHTVSDAFTLPVAVDLRAVQPHAHYRARSLQAWAIRADGARTPLLRIDDWDVNWQDRYTFVQPIRLEAGTTLRVDYTFDNSVGNPRNPDRPPQRSRWGWRSSDEMADLWLQVVSDSDDDRRRLDRAAERMMLSADAVGTEVLLAREPNHINLRNDAAGIYLALGQPGDALRHFEAVRTLQPGSAPGQFNVGVALEALGRLDEALTRYTDALTIDPKYSAAHNNSGSVLLRQGQLASARAAFERAIAADPANADAHANLGLVMAGAGQSDAALTRLQKALELKPSLLTGLVPHVWLLCASADASARRPNDGRALAERMVRETFNQDAAALDAVAMCDAAVGSFEEAIAAATAADSVVPAGAAELRDGIRRRLALYRAGQRFVLPQ